MTLAVLELNDQSLLIQTDDGTLYAEPGFARLTSEGIVTGEEAHAVAWREPQHIYNQYWCHLNQTPLAAKQKWARHHGDIAFAQLRQLWQSAGSPDSLMLLAPGSFTDNQLSLLLGMIEALPATTLAVFDSALAACLHISRETLFVDVHLHQTVLTLCRPEMNTVSIIEQEVFPDLGIMQIHNSVARHVSDLLIDSFRYDPLHASGTEQAIYNQIPVWLTCLRWEDEVSASLDTEKRELSYVLRRDNVKALLSERFTNVLSFVKRHTGCQILLSHGSSLLAGLSDEFATTDVAGLSAGTDNCLSHHLRKPGQVESLYRLRTLARSESGTPDAKRPDEESLATHVLYRDHALPLHEPVSIRIGERGIQITREIDDQAALTIVLRNRSLQTVHSTPGVDALLPKTCCPGDSIQVDGHQLKLIRVRDG
jgi:hypothetical protein